MKQQSQILFWLLLAATLAVDAVAHSRAQQEPGPTMAVAGFDALIVSQLSVVCIWSALSARTTVGKVLVVPLGGIAAVVLAISRSAFPWKDMLPNYALQFVLLWGALKLLERTPYWQRWSGRAANWRFSVFQLLLAMTIVAMLSAFISRSPYFNSDEGWINLASIAGSPCLALVAVVCWSLPMHWLQRLAGVLGCAVVLGVLFALLGETFLTIYLSAFYVIQALVLSAWLGWGPIIPRNERADDGETSATAEPSCPT